MISIARTTTDSASLDEMLTALVTDRPVQIELAQFAWLKPLQISFESRWIAVHACFYNQSYYGVDFTPQIGAAFQDSCSGKTH